jgi:Zn-dependent protease with chaperone function
VFILLLLLVGCAPQAKVVKPDWQNPRDRLVGAEVAALLTATGRSPAACQVFLIDSEKLNAVSLGECRFGFTLGLAGTHDARLIRGVAAHEVAHDLLGHADKRKAAVATEWLIRQGVSLIPGVGGLIAAASVLVVGMVALPAYSRTQEAEADARAVEVLLAAKDADPAGTMAHAFQALIAHAGAKGGRTPRLAPQYGGAAGGHAAPPARSLAALAVARRGRLHRPTHPDVEPGCRSRRGGAGPLRGGTRTPAGARPQARAGGRKRSAPRHGQ